MNGGSMDTAPAASGEAKEKAGHKTRSAVRLPGGERISTDRSGSGDPGSAWQGRKTEEISFSHEPKNKSGTHNKTPLHALVGMQRGLTFV